MTKNTCDTGAAGAPRRIKTICGDAILLAAQGYSARYTPVLTTVGFAYDGQRGAHAFASDRPYAFRTRPNSVALTPAGCEVYSHSPEGGEYLVLALSNPEQLERPSRTAQYTDRLQPSGIEAAHTLRRLMLSEHPHTRLEADEAALRLCQVATDTPDAEQKCAASMTPRRLRLLDDAIEAYIAEDLCVARLADVVGLSPGFFTRALKGAIGATPHDYVLSRRLARARKLLSRTTWTIAEIALDCGFASQAHLTHQMRRRLGATPHRLRQG